MGKYALKYDVIEKGYASYTQITREDDDQPGVPFSEEELQRIWNNKHRPWVDSVLIYIYSGWRVSELLKIPVSDIDLELWTFRGGLKTKAGKNRIVPIHSKIREFVKERVERKEDYLFLYNGKPMNAGQYIKIFKKTLMEIGIERHHTPHDCRHTFTSLLSSAGASQVCIDRLIGHASKDITNRVYVHIDIEELRRAVELIK